MMRLAGIRSRVGRLLTRARSEGLRQSATYAAHRVYEEAHDAALGIRTFDFRSPDALGYRDADLRGYVPAPYRALHACMRQLTLRPGQDVFLDYGVGMGRAVVVAARHPFARVVGIDLSREMVARARANVERARPKLRCDVEVVHADARAHVVGPEVTVVHLFNGFAGQTLARVVEEIRRSLRVHPRELTVIYGNPGAFEELVNGQGWVERQYFAEFYPATGYGVYRCRPPAS